ncbi:MAG: hypothetical protein ACLP00_01110 [Terracidiphilus sp.]
MLERYDRDELYRQVWEKPMLKVAEEYGVSSVALGKTCRKLSVPVPSRGYWAKLAHGYDGGRKPPLPKLDVIPTIYRSPVERKPPAQSDHGDPELEKISLLVSSGVLTASPVDSASRPHPLIRTTASRLRHHSRKNESGILEPRDPGALDIRVTAEALERALNVMAQIVAVLESQECQVSVSEEGHTIATFNGTPVRFGLEERVQKVVISKPRVPNPTDRWDYDREVKHEPTGKLILTISAHTWGRFEQRKQWADAKIQRIENLVPDFVAGLMRTAVSVRRQDEQRKKEQGEQERRAREREHLREAIAKEEKRLEQFIATFECWERAERMRRFIAAYTAKSSDAPPEKQAQDKGWIEWASQQADRIDPFVTEKPKSVLDRKSEIAWY